MVVRQPGLAVSQTQVPRAPKDEVDTACMLWSKFIVKEPNLGLAINPE